MTVVGCSMMFRAGGRCKETRRVHQCPVAYAYVDGIFGAPEEDVMHIRASCFSIVW